MSWQTTDMDLIPFPNPNTLIQLSKSCSNYCLIIHGFNSQIIVLPSMSILMWSVVCSMILTFPKWNCL